MSTQPVIAHTLYAKAKSGGSRRSRGYGESSKRYLGLLKTGAREHQLPTEYQDWLKSMPSFTIKGWRQSIGQRVFFVTWMPLFVANFILNSYLSKDGKLPAWRQWSTSKTFDSAWTSYDWLFWPIFGEGERTAR